ncbi:MAG TPA: hypothetical protein VFM93_02460 [Candidatus Limnocylindria bacterium]|nr:hypothetical protein [Candidatus Limnocylindria bacterium]
MTRVALLLLAVVATACAERPDVSVTVGGGPAALALASETQRTVFSYDHGDAFPRDVPLTVVRASGSVDIAVVARAATEVKGWIYDEDLPTPSGGPIDEFAFQGSAGTHTTRGVVPFRTYRVLVNARSDALLTGHDVTYVLRFRVVT